MFSSSADEVLKYPSSEALGQVPGGSGLGVNAEDHGVLANGMADGVFWVDRHFVGGQGYISVQTVPPTGVHGYTRWTHDRGWESSRHGYTR